MDHGNKDDQSMQDIYKLCVNSYIDPTTTLHPHNMVFEVHLKKLSLENNYYQDNQCQQVVRYFEWFKIS